RTAVISRSCRPVCEHPQHGGSRALRTGGQDSEFPMKLSTIPRGASAPRGFAITGPLAGCSHHNDTLLLVIVRPTDRGEGLSRLAVRRADVHEQHLVLAVVDDLAQPVAQLH